MKHYLRIVINFKNGEQKTFEFEHVAFTVIENGKFIIYDYDKECELVNQYDLSEIKDVNVYNY